MDKDYNQEEELFDKISIHLIHPRRDLAKYGEEKEAVKFIKLFNDEMEGSGSSTKKALSFLIQEIL